MAETEQYLAFVDKFKPKKTTDDCYTPDNVYAVAAAHVADRYGCDRSRFVRPFFPGGDYQRFQYPRDCVVVDNPPFSIFAQIVRFYHARGVRFFLFAPGLTALCVVAKVPGVTLVATGASVIYENGAVVCTSFATNLDDPEVVVRTAPALAREIEAANNENTKNTKKQITKLNFPDALMTVSKMNFLCKHGVDHAVRRSESCVIRRLDGYPRGIFGGGLLLSKAATVAALAAAEKAAAEKAAAEKAARKNIQLSARELALQKIIG